MSSVANAIFDQTEAELNANATPTNLAIPSHDQIGAVIPDRYLADGDADDTASIRRAQDVINELGGGTLKFFPRDYTIFSGSLTGNLCAFVNLTGIEVLGYGAKLVIPDDRDTITASMGHLFSFSACTNIKVDGFETGGPELDVSTTTVKGWEFVHVANGCKGISMPANRVTNMLAGFVAQNQTADGTPTSAARCQNIDIGMLEIKNCWYGVLGQHSGDHMRVRCLRTDTIHRSLFIFGVRDVKANVWSKNPKAIDCNLNAKADAPMTDIELNYHSDADSNACGSAERISICAWSGSFSNADDATPCVVRNVKIRGYIEFASSGNTGSGFVHINKVDKTVQPETTARGHVFDNIQIGGVIVGTPSSYNGGLIATDVNAAQWEGEKFHNFVLRDLRIDSNGGAGSNVVQLYLGGCTDNIVLDNVSSDESIVIRQDKSATGRKLPQSAQLDMRGVKCPNKSTLVGVDANSLEFLNAGNTTPTAYAGWCNGQHWLTTDNAGGDMTWALPPATPGMEIPAMRTSAVRLRLDPNSSEVIRGGGPGKYFFTDSNGGTCRLKCRVAGTWEIVSTAGAWAFEP